METTIKSLAVLIFIAVCLLAAPISYAGHSSFMGAAVFGQGRGNKGETGDSSQDLHTKKMSHMGELAQRVTKHRLHLDDRQDDPGDPAGGQAETSIALDTTGRHIVIGFNDAAGFGLNPISISGFKYSDDGGQTFTNGGLLPITTGTSFIGSDAYPQVFGDPEVKYLGGSNFIYFSIMVVNSGASGASQTIGFHRSSDFVFDRINSSRSLHVSERRSSDGAVRPKQ